MGIDAYGFVSCFMEDAYASSGAWFTIAEVYIERLEARELYRIFNENNVQAFANRGIPKDSKGQVLSKYLWLVNPNIKKSNANYITLEDAEADINQSPDLVFWWDEKKIGIYSTNHFDTWLSIKELDFVAKQSKLNSLTVKLQAVIGMMKALSEDEAKTRFLMWID
jgi:hypothetical protein